MAVTEKVETLLRGGSEGPHPVAAECTSLGAPQDGVGEGKVLLH